MTVKSLFLNRLNQPLSDDAFFLMKLIHQKLIDVQFSSDQNNEKIHIEKTTYHDSF